MKRRVIASLLYGVLLCTSVMNVSGAERNSISATAGAESDSVSAVFGAEDKIFSEAGSAESEISFEAAPDPEGEFAADEAGEYADSAPSVESNEYPVDISTPGEESYQVTCAEVPEYADDETSEDVYAEGAADEGVPAGSSDDSGGNVTEAPDMYYETEVTESADEQRSDDEELVGATVSLDSASHTQAAIRKYVLASGADLEAAVQYTTKPNTKAGSYAAGQLSDETLKNALALLNNFRYIAGLNYNVKLNSTYTKRAQAASLLLTVNNVLSKTPARPSNMSDSLYNLGSLGAKNSNLNYGAGTLGKAMLTWARDNSTLYRSTLEHRVAFLKPEMGKTGFGAVGKYFAAYISDTSAASSVTKVAWPARNMPLDYFSDSDPWSLSGVKISNVSKVKVTLVRTGDNRTWTFSQSTGTTDINSGYFSCSKGDNSTVIFKPNGITYSPGDQFSVKIAGTAEGTVSYKVNFFELVPLEAVKFNKSTIVLERDSAYPLKYTVLPANATVTNVKWSSSDSSIAKVNTYGKVTGNAPGTAKITLTIGDKSVSCKVNVTKYSIESLTGFELSSAKFIYNGSEIKPTIIKYSVKYKNLKEGVDFKVSYRNNIRPGNATLVVTGIGDYTGTNEHSFSIFPFSDVTDPSHPYYEPICWAVENGITKGYSGTDIFGINDACTRGHAVQFLWRLAGKPEPAKGAMKFIDVPATHPYYKAILWAAQKNIAIGYPAYKQFRPNNPCTRGQICTFIWRYLGKPSPKAKASPFKDSLTSSYAKAIIWMSENNIARGYSDHTFRDKNTCSRGMMVTFLYRSKDKKRG